MPAPKGNTNAAKPGTSKLYRVRATEEQHNDISLLTPEERADGLLGYEYWQSSNEYEEHSFIEWLKANLTGNWEEND